ncbi:Rpn family recombination-promoting nuclease/putative transposase [Pseudothauera nasutitermitis]|uniref:Rpn family recombination-promoting nuclease/putative transposase n=1 Tax=Pseudothauera nasutitermitis TaxID=2565930 RepID=A0A4S4AZS6_9RHOO|nr:Rpn family recombination-promoting nuclease/putative transposase [Pseudothauera nasutitermitis]THF65698.1 Rpn family recombination-promoting nuclease/putative transposase [Pseudothauera nasutitermitis]
MSRPLLDPRNDFVFKRLFSAAPDLLADLINAVRADAPPVEVVDILNPSIEPAELTGKFIVLDVLARDAAGRLYNVEMQVRRHAGWNARSAYYLARLLAGQLNGGEDYTRLKPVIGIHLLDFTLFDEPAQAHWCFELRDRRQPRILLGEELQLNVLELPKADRLLAHSHGVLADWVTWFEHWQEDDRMRHITHEPVLQAQDYLDALSANDEARRLAFVRERALRDEKTELKVAREEGLAKGRMEGQSAVLLRLLERRFGPLPDTLRERVAQAGEAELLEWTDRVLLAGSLEDILGA